MTEAEWLESVDPVAMLDWLLGNHKPSDRKLRLVACAQWLEFKRRHHSNESAESRKISFRCLSYVQRAADGEIPLTDAVGLVVKERLVETWHLLNADPREAVLKMMGGKIPTERILRSIVGNPWRPVTLPLGETCRDCDGQGFGESCSCFMYHCGEWGNKDWKSKCPSLHRLPCERCHGTGHGPSPVLTPLVLQLAEAAYTVRTGTGTLDNDALAVLSDALEEAGLPERVTCERCSGSGVLTIEATPSNISYWQGNATTELGCGYCGGESVENGRNGSGRQPNPILAHLREPGPHYRGCWAVDLLLGKE